MVARKRQTQVESFNNYINKKKTQDDKTNNQLYKICSVQ